MTTMKKNGFILLAFLALLIAGCKKKTSSMPVDPRVPPQLDLKTRAIYVYKDTTVTRQDTLLFGIVVTKTEDNLTSLNCSVAFDGSSTTSTFFNHTMSSSEYSGYSKDVTYYVRNQAGSEKVTISIVDRDGNITKKSVVVTVL